MVFPVALLAAAALGGREALEGGERASLAQLFRSGLGEQGGPYAGQGGLMEGEAAQVSPGSGLLGTTQDPQQRAYLELLGKMAGERGVGARDLIGGVERVLGLQGQRTLQDAGNQFAEQQQGRGFAQADASQGREFDFREMIQATEQDFRAQESELARRQQDALQKGQFGQAWALARYREAAETARAKEKSDLPSGLTYYPVPGQDSQGRVLQVSGPRPGTPEFRESMGSARFARDAVENVDFLLESMMTGGRGREFFGAEGGLQRAAYNRFIGDLAATRGEKGLGVLQEADREYLQNAFKDPAGFVDKIYNQDPQMLAAFGRARQDLVGLHRRRLEENPWLAGAPVGRHTGAAPTPESVAAKYAGRVAADEIRARLEPYNPRAGRQAAERDARREYAR